MAVIAGIAALVWAMRDRFISLVVPREPEPPTFRVAPPPPAAPTGLEPRNEDLTVIAGIGPVYQSRLYSAGFGTVAAVAEASADELASAAQVPEGRATDWVSKAVAVAARTAETQRQSRTRETTTSSRTNMAPMIQ